MKTTPTPTGALLAEQLKTAEAQSVQWRGRRTKLQADLAGLKNDLRAAMHEALGNSGASPALQTIRAKIIETEALLEQGEKIILDGEGLVLDLHRQLAAARSEEQKATLAAEVARLSLIVESRLADFGATLLAADKAAGALVLSLGELNAVDGAVATGFIADARCVDPEAPFLGQGWKIPAFFYGARFLWDVVPLVPPVPGLEASVDVNLPAYIKLRDAATQAAPGAKQ